MDALDSGGLPTKEAGVGDKDSGLGTKDSGLGDKDTGLGTEDSGPGGEDAGTGTEDAGTGTEDAGMPGSPDAGGVGECFACAERRGCKVQVNACLQSPTCVEEGDCDLTCLKGSKAPFSPLNPQCIKSCTKDWHATQELLAAVTCGFAVCPLECLRAVTACGGDAGDPMEPGGDLGCLSGRGAVHH